MIQTFVLILKDKGGGLEGFAQQRRRMHICIDLKSFYASVECVERNLDPLKADLVVADPTRTEKTICLAVSPSMKKKGVRNRCRVFEIPDGMDYVMAPPRMQLYINYSVRIYRILLRYFSKQDIHVYSVDESFMDVTDYLALYGMSARPGAEDSLGDICGNGHSRRMHALGIDTMGQLALYPNPDHLFKEFGKDAELLLDHIRSIEAL